jgi:hypothetical protein
MFFFVKEMTLCSQSDYHSQEDSIGKSHLQPKKKSFFNLKNKANSSFTVQWWLLVHCGLKREREREREG